MPSIRALCVLAGLVLTIASMAGCTNEVASSGAGPEGKKPAVGKQKVQQELVKMLPAKVKESGTLRVGISLASPPDEFLDKNENIVGWEPEVVRAVAQILDLEVKYHSTSFDALIPGLQADRYDITIGQIGVTKERKQVVDFVSTYLGNQLFAVRQDSDIKVDTLTDLCGHTVSTTRGSVEVELAKKTNPKCTAAGKDKIDLQVFNTPDQGGHALINNRVEIFWLGSTSVSYFVDQTQDQAKVVGHYGEPYPWGIALQKGSPLAKSVQGAVQHLIDSGAYAKILEKWGIERGSLTKSEINPDTYQ